MQGDITERGGAHAHLLAIRLPFDAVDIGGHNKGRQAPPADIWVGRGEHDHHVAERAEREVGLVAIEDVRAVGLLFGPSRELICVGSSVRLGHREGSERIAVDHRGEPPLALLCAAEANERLLRAEHLTGQREGQPVVATAIPEPFERKENRCEVGSGAAEFGRRHQTEQAMVCASPPIVGSELRCVVCLDTVVLAERFGRPGGNLLLDRMVGCGDRIGDRE